MEVTPLGMLIADKFEQPLNADSPMIFNAEFEGIKTLCNFLRPEKADAPIDTTELEIFTETICEVFECIFTDGRYSVLDFNVLHLL